jgi:hypothetical protein
MKTLIPKLFLALGLLALPTLVQAQFTFTTNNGAITITGYNTAAGLNMVIPAATNGWSVISIGNYAFEMSSLTNVTIPNSVTTIGIYAFSECTNLTSVTIPNSVTNLGLGVFYECPSLTSVTIPNSVTSIGEAVFYKCSSLTNVTIGNSVTSIGYFAFEECYSLTSVTIPNSVSSIEDEAFYDCSSLTNVAIPNSVTNIGGGVFADCTSLTSVTIGTGVTSIWENAFNQCTSLTNITVAASNPAYSSLGGILFDKAKATLIQFPGGLGGSYSISNSVTSIGDAAFGNCTRLTSVTFPNSVTNIGDSAFAGCASLTSVTIGNGVTSIGDSAFYQCLSLTNVIIPNSVTSIGAAAFYYCFSLKSAYFLGNAPPDPGTVFSYDSATVYYLYGTTGWGPTFGGVPTVLLNPPPNTLRFTGGHFGFNLTGPANAVIVVEACTNLSHPVWLPVATNTFSGSGTSTFSDLQSGAHPIRFYRVRSP